MACMLPPLPVSGSKCLIPTLAVSGSKYSSLTVSGWVSCQTVVINIADGSIWGMWEDMGGDMLGICWGYMEDSVEDYAI